MSTEKTQSNVLAVILGLSILTIIIFASWPKETEQTKENKLPEKVETKQQITVKDVEKWIESLPESSFKSNLQTVFGAEYGGDSAELNKLMKAFIEIRIQELTKEKTI